MDIIATSHNPRYPVTDLDTGTRKACNPMNLFYPRPNTHFVIRIRSS